MVEQQSFSKAVIDKALEVRPWIRKIAPNRYRVVPRRQRDGRIEHGKYECQVGFDSEGMPEVKSCREYRRNEPCQGFYYSGGCYHAASLVIKLLKRERKLAA